MVSGQIDSQHAEMQGKPSNNRMIGETHCLSTSPERSTPRVGSIRVQLMISAPLHRSLGTLGMPLSLVIFH
jgi:hypothetical protein